MQRLRLMRKPDAAAIDWAVIKFPAAVLATHLVALVAWVGICVGN